MIFSLLQVRWLIFTPRNRALASRVFLASQLWNSLSLLPCSNLILSVACLLWLLPYFYLDLSFGPSVTQLLSFLSTPEDSPEGQSLLYMGTAVVLFQIFSGSKLMYATWPFAVSLHSPTNWSPWNQFSVLVLFQEWPAELFLMDPSIWGPWAVQFLSLPAHPAFRNPFAYSLLPPSELRIQCEACYSLASVPQIWEFVELACCLLLLCVLAACFLILGLPSWPRWLRICLQRRHEFDSWIGNIPLRSE